jgi:drug/metabolite transporter (DMT)-like permease
MVLASLMFATMGVCVKFASESYGAGEIVMYRGVVGVLLVGALARTRGVGLATTVPAMHFWRNATGVTALMAWFYAIGGLPLATGMTLNYMSSVWMAVFLVGGAVVVGSARIDGRLIAAVLVGFAGVALVLKPTIGQDQLGAGLAGLLSGMLSALAYLQVTALSRAGEPELRIVFYFSLGGVLAGALLAVATGGLHVHTWSGGALLLAVGLLAAGAQLLLTRAYAIGRPLANASLAYLGIVFSVGYGVWLFDDPLPWSAVAGMMLIVAAGVAATMLRVQKAPAKDLPTGGDA